MTLMKHELRQGRISLLVWTASIAVLVLICVLIFPEMADQADAVGEMFASLGVFTEAIGMDQLNLGTLSGFYAVECGSILGIGGALFSALLGISSLSKEEKDHTAEFLMTHPLKRRRILSEKLLAVFIQIIVMNGIVFMAGIGSVLLIGEEIPWKEVGLLHLAYFLMQIEIAGICFGISSFLRRSGAGVGLGIAMMAYFLNIIANITEKAEFLKYVTPFGYTEGADIVSDGCLDTKLLLTGLVYTAAGIAAAYWKYCRKDIR